MKWISFISPTPCGPIMIPAMINPINEGIFSLYSNKITAADAMKIISKGAKQFVAFIFLVFTAGMLFALFISNAEPLLLFVPPLLGLVAFYNENISYILLAAIVIFIFI